MFPINYSLEFVELPLFDLCHLYGKKLEQFIEILSILQIKLFVLSFDKLFHFFPHVALVFQRIQSAQIWSQVWYRVKFFLYFLDFENIGLFYVFLELWSRNGSGSAYKRGGICQKQSDNIISTYLFFKDFVYITQCFYKITHSLLMISVIIIIMLLRV